MKECALLCKRQDADHFDLPPSARPRTHSPSPTHPRLLTHARTLPHPRTCTHPRAITRAPTQARTHARTHAPTLTRARTPTRAAFSPATWQRGGVGEAQIEASRGISRGHNNFTLSPEHILYCRPHHAISLAYGKVAEPDADIRRHARTTTHTAPLSHHLTGSAITLCIDMLLPAAMPALLFSITGARRGSS